MKYRYLSIIFLILVLSIGAVCAQDNATDVGNVIAASSDDVISVDSNANVLSSGNSISIDDNNYNDYFSENGTILENANISDDDTIILGNINDKVFDIDMPLTITSNGTTINNVVLILNEGSDNSIIENLTVNCNDAKNTLFTVNATNISIQNNIINFVGAQNASDIFAIYAELADNLNIQANTITYVGKTDGSGANGAVYVSNSENVNVEGNTLNITIPSADVDWSTGIALTSGVKFLSCGGLEFIQNTIELITEASVGSYPTVYVIDISKSDNVVFDSNNVTAKSYVNSSYLYSLLIQGNNFNVSGNEFDTFSDTNYVCGIDVESNSNGIIDGNRIEVTGVSAYGIYTADWAGDVKADITNNNIDASGNTIFGMSLTGSESLVDNNNIAANGNFTTGIASKVGNIAINNNTITANGSNVGTPLGYDSMGIETTGVHIVGGNAIVTNNNITANNKYAVDFDGEGQVTDNEIHAEILTGDFAVDYSQDGTVLVVNNTPEMELDYKLTNDTFYIYFDEEGIIREQIEADNLTFIGEFSNLVSEIYITKPIVLLSDNATLNSIVMSVESDNVTVDGFNFKGARSGITVLNAENVQILNNNLTVDGLNDSSNVCIKILNSDNVLLDNNTVTFSVETNDTYLNAVIVAENSDNLIMGGNIINALLPARSVNWTSGEVYSQGVFLNGCDNAVLENNTIGIKSNGQISTYDTIYAVNIKGDNATLTDNAIGAIEAPYGYALVITGENFNINNNILAALENATYACAVEVDGVSSGIIDSNIIHTVANASAYGIYTANWAGDVKVNITNNYIGANANSPFALSLTGSEVLVENNTILSLGNYTTGIASAVGNITINNNTITANGSNVGTPLGYDSMGIETTGIHIVSGHATVTNNNVTTTGEFAVDLEGTGQVTDNYLIADEYTGDASVNFTPDQSTMVKNNTPAMLRAVISAENIVMYYKNGTRYVVTLTDQDGNPLAKKTVILTINNVTYTRTTKDDGTASLAINLDSGNYTASASYVGESGYTNASITNNITVLTTIYGNDLVKMFRNGTQYYATFLDLQGNLLVDTNVTFNINGVMYTRTTNQNGTAKLNINLEPGTYILTAINPVNGEMHSNNVTVLPTIGSSDLVKYYKNESQYIVTLYGADGKAVGAGESVTFNINGVFYTRTTNELGQAKLNINLEAGNYTITAEYKGCRVSNNIEVKSVLTAKDLVKKYGVSDQFIAYLVDGQGNPYGGQTVNFNIHGVFYERVTDSDGRAILNIRLGAASDVYIITSEYNGCRITNTITIVP